MLFLYHVLYMYTLYWRLAFYFPFTYIYFHHVCLFTT